MYVCIGECGVLEGLVVGEYVVEFVCVVDVCGYVVVLDCVD